MLALAFLFYSYMRDVLADHTELQELVNTGYGMGHITVFAPSDAVMNQISQERKDHLKQNPAVLYDVS